MGIVCSGRYAFFKFVIIFFADSGKFVERAEIASHRENAVCNDDASLSFADSFLKFCFKIFHIVVLVDEFECRAGKFHRVDDAVVVELVADDDRFIGDKREKNAHRSDVCARENHRRFSAVELRKSFFKVNVSFVGSRNETYCAGAYTESLRSFFLSLDDFVSHRKTEITV